MAVSTPTILLESQCWEWPSQVEMITFSLGSSGSLVPSLHRNPSYTEWHSFVSTFGSAFVLLGPISGSVRMIEGRTLLCVSLCDLLYAQGINNPILLIPLGPVQCLVHGEGWISVWGVWCNEAEVGLPCCWKLQKARGGGVPCELLCRGRSLGKERHSPLILRWGCMEAPLTCWSHPSLVMSLDYWPIGVGWPYRNEPPRFPLAPGPPVESSCLTILSPWKTSDNRKVLILPGLQLYLWIL